MKGAVGAILVAGCASASSSAPLATVDDTSSAPLAEGIAIREIAVFQGVKVDVMRDGAAIPRRNAPLVAKRDALVRVYVDALPSFEPHPLRAELRITSHDALRVFTAAASPSLPSTDAALASTFNFEVPGDAVDTDATYAVALTDPASTGPRTGTAARFPQHGHATLDARGDGDALRIVVVPIRYDADGSHRLPAIDAAQIETYRATMFAYYPAARVDITVRDPIAYAGAITANGDGLEALLSDVLTLRQTDGAPDDTYYFGAFAPAASLNAFCGQECVTGLSAVADRSDPAVRASVGTGFAGREAALTMAHELAHAHGRAHAPCGTSAADPAFPYAQGGIGVWGYDLSRKVLVTPDGENGARDLMGYCTPAWISDYTFGALFDRMAVVSDAPAESASPASYRFVHVTSDGSLALGGAITLASRPRGEPRSVRFEGSALTREAHFYAYGDRPGGFYFVPEAPPGATSMRLEGHVPIALH